jgi:hypothetical protein
MSGGRVDGEAAGGAAGEEAVSKNPSVPANCRLVVSGTS